MRRLIILAAYLVASLSASDAAPGARIRVYAGCDSGLIAVDAQQGIRVGSVDGEGLGQTVDLAIAADWFQAWRQPWWFGYGASHREQIGAFLDRKSVV